METIKGMTFGFMSKRGDWQDSRSRESLRLMQERCGVEYVILPITVTQAHPQSTKIDWQADEVVTDEEVKELIAYAKSLGLKVILKPMVNVADGTWRAHINFFDHDVPCEPKWSEWFASYGEYLNHYARLAEETKCEMFVVGCELVNADRREAEWRALIKEVRQHYQGLITYNCDKYQENHLTWWDAVDVISSSGYYPLASWDEELNRIEEVVRREDKPFFFCEAGCPSRVGSEYLPNDWTLLGDVSLDAQNRWFQAMFNACDKRDWVQGFGIWDWKAFLYSLDEAAQDRDYALYGKPAEATVLAFYKSTK